MSNLHRMKLADAPATGGAALKDHRGGPPLALVVESAGRSASGGSETSAGSASSMGTLSTIPFLGYLEVV